MNPAYGFGLMDQQTDKAPTSDDLRQALLARANEYAELATGPNGKKPALGTISDKCAGDGKFLSEISKGGNFTVDRYTKAMAWFDANWPASADSEAA